MSNQYRKAEIDRRLAELRQLAAKRENVRPENVEMTNVNAFYVLQAEYIDAKREERNREEVINT